VPTVYNEKVVTQKVIFSINGCTIRRDTKTYNLVIGLVGFEKKRGADAPRVTKTT
jgi:hypothetical protein